MLYTTVSVLVLVPLTDQLRYAVATPFEDETATETVPKVGQIMGRKVAVTVPAPFTVSVPEDPLELRDTEPEVDQDPNVYPESAAA
jgi:hypothetical protein